LDAFWDGRRSFAIVLLDEEGAGPGLRPDLAVVSARDAAFAAAATLVDSLGAARTRRGCCVFELPPGHAHVSLRAGNGDELRFVLLDEGAKLPGGETRLLLVETSETPGEPVAFRSAGLSARGDAERAARGEIARSGGRLVWALRQRRVVERREGAAALMHLWASERIFPAHQTRITVEAIEAPATRGPASLKAPFAIMENWLRENGAPCPILRIRAPGALDQNDPLLARAAVAHVLHQRRWLGGWMRGQRALGEPIVDPLDPADIRRALGDPDEKPETVEANRAIVVHNLARVVAGPETSFDGLAVTRRAEESGLVADLHFFGASLGDDIGLVATSADAGDFGVVPNDPGGAPYVRLFRVESDGAAPRRIADEDRLLDEILRVATEAEREATGDAPSRDGDRAASAQGRRETLLAGLNAALASAGYAGRFHAARLWDIFEPLTMTSFVALAADAGPDGRAALTRLGGYDAYRADPALMDACVRRSALVRGADEADFRDFCGGAKPLLRRFLGLCRAPGVAAETLDLTAETGLWELLAETDVARRAIDARIELSGGADIARVAETTALLLPEAMVDRAAIYCDDLLVEGEARSLRDYLARRRAGAWTRLDEAARLAVIVDEANAYWRRLDTGRAAAEPIVETRAPTPAPAKPDGLLATMRNLLRRGAPRGPRA
jgi:hypothetical protein